MGTSPDRSSDPYSRGNNTSRITTRCAYCGRRKRDYPDERYFRFPRDAERCKKWVEACNRPCLFKKSPASLNLSYRLCSRHFDDSSYRTVHRHFLHLDAVPTIFSDRDNTSVKDAAVDVRSMAARLKSKLGIQETEPKKKDVQTFQGVLLPLEIIIKAETVPAAFFVEGGSGSLAEQ